MNQRLTLSGLCVSVSLWFNRRQRFICRVLLATLAAGLAGSAPAAEHSKPNIILILADDQGYGDASCYNDQSKVQTPNIDQIAKEGIRFTDGHSPASVCTPTRYATLTGRHAWRGRLKLGVLQQYEPALIEEDRLTWPAMLHKQGYATAGFGKWHLGWTWATKEGQAKAVGPGWKDRVDFNKPITHGPITRGFDYFFGMVGATPTDDALIENDRPLYWQGKDKMPSIAGVPAKMLNPWQNSNSLPMLTEKVDWYIREHHKEHPKQPMFIYFALTAPHMPIIPTEEFVGKTKGGIVCDFVAQLDSTVGRVLQALKDTGQVDNTLIVFSSDNGSPCYADPQSKTFSIQERYHHDPSRPWRGMKGDIWEGGHRVPFVARWPGHIPAGTVSNEIVSLVDLYATSAAITGAMLPPNAAEDSYNILPALLNQPRSKPIREATIHHALIGTFAIRQGDWKLCTSLGSGGFSDPQVVLKPQPGEPTGGQLYNLAEDPGEKNNIYDKHPEIVARLSALLKKYQDEGRSAPHLSW
ncbi:MAG: arylsulfatase [Planctomycetes bacterium]|nr:arylsulfatase [Planctomycetota bacterium]